MSPKRGWPTDEEQQDDMYDDPEECLSDGDTTQRDVNLGMLGDVLLDILDELCQMHELLRQLTERGCRPSTTGPT